TTWGPHDPGVVGGTSPASPAPHSHALAALTLANVVVTDLSTNTGTVYSFDNPAPTTSVAGNCNTSATAPLCLSFGAAAQPSGTFSMVQSSLSAGSLYAAGTISVNVGSASCGIGTGGQADAAAAAELDQFVLTSTPSLQTAAVQFDCTNSTVDIAGTIAYNIFPTDPNNGYYVFGQQGELTGFGNDNYLAYLDGAQYYALNAPIVGMTPTPDGAGYWMVGSDGGVFSSGDAGFFGSTGSIHLNKPVVGMAATPDGGGYWFVASDGGIFSYGDAQFYGSMGGKPLNKPIVGMAATPDGGGYWLVASDGGIFAYGDAQFYGSTGSIHLNEPVVAMAPTPDGAGYWFVAADGGIFAYGDAQFYGSTGSIHLNAPIVGMAATHSGHGYWFVASDGGVFNYGDATFEGSLGGTGISDVAGISLGAGRPLI
ncbi:MAG TPA: hypothetical protein VMU09_13855, partial [Acidimicrobiales bacterium]|nr:hypothetical protein [Acidimicrobiales bacterium]